MLYEKEKQMHLHKLQTYDEMSAAAAQIFSKQITEKPDGVLGLATGTTPIGLYDRLAEMNDSGKLDFSKIRTVNLDEYCGLQPDHEQSYRFFMEKYLFSRVNIPKGNTNLPNGAAQDYDAECKRYDELIERLGGVDLQLLGIGNNGHIGFNEPADFFSGGTQRVKLTESTIQANARLFADASEVPDYALTMGIKTIMLARKIILLANGGKREIVERALYGPITSQVPASILQVHQNLEVVICEEN